MYSIYDGLHIAPFGPLKPKQEAVVKDMGEYNFKKIAANYCTGIPAVKKMVELGCPVVKGTERFGAKSDLFVGNGDEVFFGQKMGQGQPSPKRKEEFFLKIPLFADKTK